MKNIALLLFSYLLTFLSLFPLTTSVSAQADQVSVVYRDDGMSLVVNGQDFMINGMNPDYFPIGTTYTYIYEKYGIYTMINHSFGRYGLTLDGEWVPNTEYADPRTRELLLSEVKALAAEYKNTPGLLLYLLGNENNYGLFREGAETEDIPIEDRKPTIRARAMYQLFNEATKEMKAIDSSRPVAICTGVGGVGNSIGGFTFQFSDGWWKFGQTTNLSVHDNNASWSNGGYQRDFTEGENNMNEEWFGICAKGPTNARGLYQLYPRAAYYALKEVHQLNPYADEVSLASINDYFSNISLMEAMRTAKGD